MSPEMIAPKDVYNIDRPIEGGRRHQLPYVMLPEHPAKFIRYYIQSLPDMGYHAKYGGILIERFWNY
jgi:hypothetical protein